MSSVERAGLILVVAGALVHVAWALFPQGPLFTSVLTPRVLLAVSSLIKLALLLAAAIWAFRGRDRLEPGNPARRAWGFLSLGCLSTFAGQLSFAPYQIFAGTTPFPSAADIFFMLGYPFFITAIATFLRAYRDAGLPMGSSRERTTLLAVSTAAAVLIAIPLLRPIVASEDPWLERLLSVAYPVLDLALLVPLLLLLRVALRLRGGKIWPVWAFLLGGFLFVCIGDILFAYFSILGQEALDPLLDATYILSYGLIALGTRRQLRLVSA
jgi:hypothetical protein